MKEKEGYPLFPSKKVFLFYDKRQCVFGEPAAVPTVLFYSFILRVYSTVLFYQFHCSSSSSITGGVVVPGEAVSEMSE